MKVQRLYQTRNGFSTCTDHSFSVRVMSFEQDFEINLTVKRRMGQKPFSIQNSIDAFNNS